MCVYIYIWCTDKQTYKFKITMYVQKHILYIYIYTAWPWRQGDKLTLKSSQGEVFEAPCEPGLHFPGVVRHKTGHQYYMAVKGVVCPYFGVYVCTLVEALRPSGLWALGGVRIWEFARASLP